MPKLRTAVFADGKWFKAGDDAPDSVTNPAALAPEEKPSEEKPAPVRAAGRSGRAAKAAKESSAK